MDIDNLWNELLGTLEGWAEGAAAIAPNVLVALIVGALFYYGARGVRALTVRAFDRAGMRQSVRDLLARIIQFSILAAGLMVCLSILELSKAVTSILAGAGVVGLALGFAFQDLAANFISGVGLSVRHPFETGDIIETNGVLGVVESIELRTTTLRTFDGKRMRVPNKKIFEEILINHTDNDLKRVDVSCGVSYGDDLEHVEEIAMEALLGLSSRADQRDPEIMFTGFGGSSIDFDARVWINYTTQRDLVKTKDEIVRALKAAFDDNDIKIPFPIRTLDFGIKGGETLDAMLPNGRSPDRGEPRASSANAAN